MPPRVLVVWPLPLKELSFVDVSGLLDLQMDARAPYGHAFGYFSEEATRKVRHQSGNWTVSANAQDISGLLDYTDKTLPGARKFERGQPANMLLNAGLESSLDLLGRNWTWQDIQKHNRELCTFFLDNFPQKKFELITPKDHMANIICLKTRHQRRLCISGRTTRKEQYLCLDERGQLALEFSPLQRQGTGWAAYPSVRAALGPLSKNLATNFSRPKNTHKGIALNP